MFLSLINCCQRLIVSVNRTDCSCLDPHEGRKDFYFRVFSFFLVSSLCVLVYITTTVSGSTEI